MSGPVTPADDPADSRPVQPERDGVEVTESRAARVGELPIRRALPRRERRTVGAWCFVDHMGPVTLDERGLGIAPHPHIGLQTVTWLLEGEALHRDSLGTEQLITPGQLNLMTAGHGVSHSEEGTGRSGGVVHGAQLWVAQPSRTRDGAPAFEHHAELPQVELEHGTGTVLVGVLAGATSPARRDTDHFGVDLDLRPGTNTVELRPEHEHALVVLTGRIRTDGKLVEPGHLGYLGVGRDALTVDCREPARLLLIGGAPFAEQVLMWWNFVARTRDEMIKAHADWTAQAERFGLVASDLARIEVAPPPWNEPRPA